jgi:hypothetical protein
MNYEIHIQDVANLEDPLILHFAERGTINLNWMGGDDKTQPIVGSELNFTLEVLDGEDAKYDQYFTTNEQKWKVTKILSDTQEIVWQGYLLPESYDEPYAYPLFYVNFSAVDGLGLLKGKTLAPDFYEKEHYVTEVLAACLKLTGIPFDIYLAPAIQNHLKKKWHQIVIDGRKYYDEDKLPSAFEILEELLSSMRCQLFQAQGRWYIEGINKRHLVTVNFDKYSIDGVYKGSVDVAKNVKKLTWLPTPSVSMVPAYKEVTVTHDAPKLQFNEQAVQETAINWSKVLGVSNYIYPRHWLMSANYRPKVVASDYYLELPASGVEELNTSNKLSLREKPYVLKDTKVRFKMQVELLRGTKPISTEDQTNGNWTDILAYKVKLNDTVLYYNETTNPEDEHRLEFDNRSSTEVTMEFIAQENGYIDVELFEPRAKYDVHWVTSVRIKKLEIEDIEEKKEFVYKEILNEDSSQTQEIKLAFSDDYSAVSKCFYLEKFLQYDPGFGSAIVEIPILYSRQQNGKNYAFVSLQGAVLIEEYPTEVSWNFYFINVKDPKVIYNLNGGEEMAIETDAYYDSGKFFVNVRPYRKAAIDRTEWLKWSDAVYGVEQKPYAQVVAEIEGKLFSSPHLRIEGSADKPVKYNDIIQFDYKGAAKYFINTNVNWNSGENETGLTMIEGIYAGESFGNLPPYVDAGPDLYLGTGETAVQVTQAVAQDPDGFIDTLLWEQISGDVGATFSSANALNPSISNLSGDEYTFRLTATDNLGVTASDEMRVIRKNDYLLQMDATWITDLPTHKELTYNVYLHPNIPADVTVSLSFDLLLDVWCVSPQAYGFAEFWIVKNGVEIYRGNQQGNTSNKKEYSSILNFVSTDQITLGFKTTESGGAAQEGNVKATTRLEFTKATFTNGSGNVSNIPLVQEITTTAS